MVVWFIFLILRINLPYALWNLTLAKKLIEKRLNHSFLSNKDTSQTLYQSLEKLTLKNF